MSDTPRRILVFRCPNCGEYHVEEETLLSFLTETRVRQLKQRFTEPEVVGAALVFSGSCPKCQKNGKGKPILKVLRQKKLRMH